MNVGDQIRVKSSGRVGAIHSVIEMEGRTLYMVMYPLTEESLRPLRSDPPEEAGIMCSEANLEKIG